MRPKKLINLLWLAIVMFVISMVFIGVTKVLATETTNPNEDSNVVYYIPHQDDDILTFGVSILNHLENGHNVHVVLLTDGSNSVVRTRLGMTREDFSRARNNEFLRAMATLGVPRANIHFKKIPDGTLTVENVKPIIKQFETLYPKAKHKAFSTLDGHTDHVTSGKALEELERCGVVTDARYYIQQAYTPYNVRTVKEVYTEEYGTVLRKAGSFYKIKIPSSGLLGIGYQSVPKSFDAFNVQPESRYHRLLP